MVFVLKEGSWGKIEPDNVSPSDYQLYVIRFEEIEQYKRILSVDQSIISQCLQRKTFTFEHQGKIDYIGILCLSKTNWQEPGEKICICAGTNWLAFIYEKTHPTQSAVLEIVEASIDAQSSISRLFVSYLEKIITGHIEQHEQIEDEIASLENKFLTAKKNPGPGQILALQKRLLLYKRYYEQLQHVLDDVQETTYHLIDEESMRQYTIYVRRIERLLKNVLVLREYVTQVRESYEAETDISLNSIMRLFTVVTVIFLPLTLLVGWYGMNLRMPEYKWIWGYPLVIVISLAIVVFSIVLFKKKKWF